MRISMILWAGAAMVAESAPAPMSSLEIAVYRPVDDRIAITNKTDIVALNAFLGQLAQLYPFYVLIQDAADMTRNAESFLAQTWDITVTDDAVGPICEDF